MNEEDRRIIRDAFGKRVRSVRKDRGLSQERLALACALDRTCIGGIARGERNVSLINIRKIARAPGIAESELLE